MSLVLHIEDDAANRLLVRKLLARDGHVVVEAMNGLEGVKLARERTPDLVLVDLRIPGLDGFEVTLRLRGIDELAGVPIIAITAEGDRDTSLAVGCDGFIRKPIDARSFAATIREYLKGAREVASVRSDSLLREQGSRIVEHLEEKVHELSMANARLLELANARTEFYRNISHELATPLTPIVGYVKLLIDEDLGPLAPAQRRALGSMQTCITRLRGVLDNLVDVTSLERKSTVYVFRDTDLKTIIKRARDMAAEVMNQKEVTIVAEIPEGDLKVAADVDRLSRALFHLVDNAIKFSPEKAAVGLRVTRLDGGYEITIADSGPGIPRDKLVRIFEPFYQVDGSPTRAYGGVGVGLAIAKHTVEGHGGDIGVLSPCRERIGGRTFEGASFTASLRAKPPDAPV